MKKVLVFLVLAVMLVSVCACSYVPSTRFMSGSQVNALVKEYGNPQAEVTLSYTIDSKEHEIKMTYELLLSQTPLAVIRFIQLANDGFYDDTVIDTYHSSAPLYMILGRYTYKESKVNDGKMTFYVNNGLDVTFKGEFASNNYGEPKEGYAVAEAFSLAMYYDNPGSESSENFDKANGTLMLTLDNVLNSNNHAVFAHMISVSYDGGTARNKMPNSAMENLKSFTSRTSERKIYTDETEETTIPSFSMMNKIVTVHVKILGDHDWSKLPQIKK